MVDYKKFNLESFDFKDEIATSWANRISGILNKIARPRVALQSSPVKLKAGIDRGQKTHLEQLTDSVGLYKPHLGPLLSFHYKRLLFRNTVRQIVYQGVWSVVVRHSFPGLTRSN